MCFCLNPVSARVKVSRLVPMSSAMFMGQREACADYSIPDPPIHR
jgi:hypothetical protein